MNINIVVINGNLYLLEVYELILTSFGYKDGYDGRNICNTLKQPQPIKNIPVVMVSGNYPIERYISGRCQPDSFLEKPFDIDNLVSVIESQL